jgi:hypothetical protein
MDADATKTISSDSVERAFNFHQSEYDALREEIITLVKEADRAIYLGLPGAAISATWLLSSTLSLPKFVFGVPLLISLISCLFYYQKGWGAKLIGEYISKIENIYALKSIGGWESTGSPGRIRKWFLPINLGVVAFWLVFNLSTLYFFFWAIYKI